MKSGFEAGKICQLAGGGREKEKESNERNQTGYDWVRSHCAFDT